MKPQDTDPYTDPECYGDDFGGCCLRTFVGCMILSAFLVWAFLTYVWPR